MSEHKHLTGDQLIRGFYGEENASCGECRAGLQKLEARRAEAAAPEEVGNEYLAAQRRAIYTRMGERPRSFGAWVPAFATAAALAIGIYVYQPGRTPAVPAQTELGDAQLFSELVSLQQSAEPRAALPIQALFEEKE